MNRLAMLGLVLVGVGCAGNGGHGGSASSSSSGSSGAGRSGNTAANGSTSAGTDGGASGGSQVPTDLCASIRQASAPVLEQAEHANPHVYDRLRARVESFVRCLETPNGAWGMVVERLNPAVREYGAFQREEGSWSLVHLSRDGTRVAVSPAMPIEGRDFSDDPLNLIVGNPESAALGDAMLYDYDGDGEPELLLVVREEIQDYGEIVRGRVWTYRRGAVEVYAPAHDIVMDQARDVDGDGRPDLVTHVPYHDEWEDYCLHKTVPVDGPNLLAHSLPDGSFSTSDAVALRAASQSCPSPPATLVATTSNGGIDNHATALNVACARLHGLDANALITHIQHDCHPGQRTENSCTPGCNDVALLTRWARIEPPVSLAPAPEAHGRRRRRR